MAQYDTQYTASPEQLPERPNRWPLAAVMAVDVILAIVATLVVVLLVSTVIVGVRALQQDVPMSDQSSPDQIMRLLGADGVFAILLLQNAIFVAVPILRVRLLRREPLSEIGFQARNPLLLIVSGFGLGMLVLVGNAILGYLFNSAGIRQNQAEQFPLFPGDVVGQALFLVSAAILAPIGEEVLFRGYVFNAIRLSFGAKPWGIALAYLASASLFMVVHSLSATQGLIGLLVPTFVMGLVLAWGMHRTGSLIPCIIAHAFNNGVALLALLVCVNNPGLCPVP
jgi:membrane protease YdiL (CAAX protease family)